MREKGKARFVAFTLLAALSLLPLYGCGGAPAEVTLSETSAVLYVGETKQLSAQASAGAEVAYSSTDAEVASVSESGLVTAKKVGASVILARAGGGVAVCEIVVSGEAPVKLESLTITGRPERDTLSNASSVTLDFVKQPENANDYRALVWSSSDEAVAQVDRRGRVQAVGPGECDVVLTAVGTEVSASFRLTVAPRAAAVRLNFTDVLGKRGETLALSAQISGDYPAEEAIWTTENNSVATVEDGIVQFTGDGSTVVSYSALFGGERVAASCRVTVEELAGFTVLRTPEEIQDIKDASGNYALGNDVDFLEAVSEGGALWNGGAGFVPLFSTMSAAFTGVFDGCGYTISNLIINRPSAPITAFIAFLSSTPGSEGQIRNLGLVRGSITGTNAAPFFGNCSGKGSERSGLFNCYAEGMEITGALRAAGLCLALNGSMENCYSACELNVSEGGARYGAAAMQASATAPAQITATYALRAEGVDFSGISAERVDALSGLKTEGELRTAATYSGWDTGVWRISDGAFPALLTPYERAYKKAVNV